MGSLRTLHALGRGTNSLFILVLHGDPSTGEMSRSWQGLGFLLNMRQKFLSWAPDSVSPPTAAFLDIHQYQQLKKEKLRSLQFGVKTGWGENWHLLGNKFVLGILPTLSHLTQESCDCSRNRGKKVEVHKGDVISMRSHS